MLDTSARLLRLLATLQTRRHWTGSELAERLEVTGRTLRRDVERLRALGYAVEASSGPGGGYQLGTGTSLPPLLLSDDESVALAVALRTAMDTFVNLDETVVGLLAKVEQLLPLRLRGRARAVGNMTVAVGSPRLDAHLLLLVATACRDEVELTFHYTSHDGSASQRRVEPLRLAHTGNRRWYLVAWDLGGGGWRTFRVDRIRAPETGARFVPRPPPPDLGDYVAESISSAPYRFRARLRLFGAADEMRQRVPPWIGNIQAVDDRTCELSIGADSLEALASYTIHANVDFELLEPPELGAHLRLTAQRLQEGARAARVWPPVGG